jgi:hypothetical protein
VASVMARHSAPHTSTVRRAVLALATAGVALGTGATDAAADSAPVRDGKGTRPPRLGDIDSQAGLHGLTGSVRYVTGPVQDLKPNPLAGTGVDPLDNGVGTQFADFKPPTSKAVTGPVAQARSVGGVPLLGQVLGLLHG